jgi:hypothetical protein
LAFLCESQHDFHDEKHAIAHFTSPRSLAQHYSGEHHQSPCSTAWVERDGKAYSSPVFPTQTVREIQPYFPSQNTLGTPKS